MALETDRRSFLKGIAAGFAAATMVTPQALLAAIPEKANALKHDDITLFIDPENSLWWKATDGSKTYMGQMTSAILDYGNAYAPPIFGTTIPRKLQMALPTLDISALVDTEGFMLAHKMVDGIMENPVVRSFNFIYDNGVGKPFHIEGALLGSFQIDDHVINPTDFELSKIHMSLMV